MARKRRRNSSRSGCSRVRVSFKTRRGRKLTFMARRGPSCGPRKFTAKQKAWQRKIAAAGRACAKGGRFGKPGSGTNRACLRHHLSA